MLRRDLLKAAVAANSAAIDAAITLINGIAPAEAELASAAVDLQKKTDALTAATAAATPAPAP